MYAYTCIIYTPFSTYSSLRIGGWVDFICVYVYIYIYIHIYVYVHIYIWIYTEVYIYLRIFIHICIYYIHKCK
jgi:hypothetical protein